MRALRAGLNLVNTRVQVIRSLTSSYIFRRSANITDEISINNALGGAESLAGHGATIPWFLQVNKCVDRVAIIDEYGVHRYQDIAFSINSLADRICDHLNAFKDDTKGERICILCPSNASYVVAQLSAWMTGCIAVPLSDKHPPAQLEYFIRDSQCRMVISSEQFTDVLKPITDQLGVHLLTLKKSDFCMQVTDHSDKPFVERWSKRINRIQQLREASQLKNRRALIVYTSGTTGNPKGVVHTHGSLQAQVMGMVDRWAWDSSDMLLHVLPLHHVHGNINAMVTPLACGASCVFLPNFEPSKVWSYLLNPPNETALPRSINMFMAVPTMYVKLIEYYDSKLRKGFGSKAADYVRSVCLSKIRLFVSGSAALPETVMNRWAEITGHTMLERYGMTEFGMALTNPLNGHRKPGSVGKPFPFVEVCIAKSNVYVPTGYDVIARGNSQRTTVTPGCEDASGELYVKGPNVFLEYWNRPTATVETFTSDGWFKTGDTVGYEDGSYRILGRTSVDIIKSGGYKISALDIERILLEHPLIAEVAVVGVSDITWGQKIAAVVVLRSGLEKKASLTLEELRTWSKQRLPSYQVPTELRIINAIPRNALGKVNKKELVADLFKKRDQMI